MGIRRNKEAKWKRNTGNFVSSVEAAVFLLRLILHFIIMKYINGYTYHTKDIILA